MGGYLWFACLTWHTLRYRASFLGLGKGVAGRTYALFAIGPGNSGPRALSCTVRVSVALLIVLRKAGSAVVLVYVTDGGRSGILSCLSM